MYYHHTMYGHLDPFSARGIKSFTATVPFLPVGVMYFEVQRQCGLRTVEQFFRVNDCSPAQHRMSVCMVVARICLLTIL
jgi:hypothetical protein